MLAHQSEPFLKLTSQFVAASCEGNRLRKQMLELTDALRDIELLPIEDAIDARDMARAALEKYYRHYLEAK